MNRQLDKIDIDRNILLIFSVFVVEVEDVYFKVIFQVIVVYSYVWDLVVQVVVQGRCVVKWKGYKILEWVGFG